MLELQGKFNTAKVFTDNIEQEAVEQIIRLLDQEFARGSRIRIMPDTHAGAGCTIGTTMTVMDKVVPNLVGVDIGCGMETAVLADTHVELQRLDEIIHEYIPAGFDVREKPHMLFSEVDLSALRCAGHVNMDRAQLSLGTLGGGNHFIELDRDDDGRMYLVVHSGSRNLGKQVAEYYQKAAAEELEKQSRDVSGLIAALKAEGREREIQAELRKRERCKVDKTLAFAQGRLFEDYIHDMEITQKYALLNRRAIVRDIVKHMQLKVHQSFATIHNYIETDTMILRKGAISAKLGERALIPINMRDGSLVCIGKGNPDWNFSAPHGAGRLMSRSAAKQSITLAQFRQSMQGIFSSTVNQSTIDESPFAYKPMDEIMANIADTVEVVKIIRPLYNFKAAE